MTLTIRIEQIGVSSFVSIPDYPAFPPVGSTDRHDALTVAAEEIHIYLANQPTPPEPMRSRAEIIAAEDWCVQQNPIQFLEIELAA